MKTDQAIDFAKPYMDAKNALANMHEAMVNRDYDYALQSALDVIADVRIAIAAIRHEKEIKHGISD